MSETIGRGVIEVSADATKLKVGIEDAKRSIAGMGDVAVQASGRASKSIDNYVKSLQVQNATMGMSTRQADQYRLALRGATVAQLAAADAAHAQADAQRDAATRAAEAEARSASIAKNVRIGVLAIGAAAIAAYGAFDHLVKGAGDFQDMSEKTGDSAENIASLAVAAGTAGIEMSAVADLAIKLSKNLVGVDDDSAAAGMAVKALGLNLADLKKMAAADRLEAVAKALNGFADGAVKGDVAIALLGKAGAEALPFLKELGQEGGRQLILTDKQIALADDYADKQAKMRTQVSLYAQSIATELLPSLTDLTGATVEFAKQITGVGKSATDLKNITSIAEWADTAALSVASLVDGFTAVSRAIEEVQLAKAASNKGLLLALHGEFSEGIQVGKDAQAAMKAIEDRPLFSTGLKKRIAERQIAQFNAENKLPGAESKEPAKPVLTYNGVADTSKAKEAAKLANAQLGLDLENIRKAGQAQIEAYSNAERVMETLRSAGLTDDKDYYDAKLGFIRLSSSAQEDELQAEIDRLQKDSAIGKQKIDNQKKIAEAQGKIDKLRTDAVTAIEVNTIQEEAANRRIAQSYVDATKAAEQYLATIKKQDGRTIAGLGKGDKFRQDQSARGQMSDAKDSKVDALDTSLRNNQITQKQYDTYLQIATDTYAAEVAAYNDRTAKLDAAQGDWLLGAQDAWANYLTHAQDVAGQSSAAFTNAFEGMADGVSNSIAKTIVTGESLGDSLKSVALSIAESFIAAFIKIGIQKLLVDKVSAGAFAGTIAAQSQAMVAMAGLNAFASTAAIPVVGPFLAPEAAAGAVAAAEVMAGLATAAASISVLSAEGGMDIPAGINPLTQLHEKEMVLPAQHADTIRRLGQSAGGAGANNGPTKYTIVNNTSARIAQVEERQISSTERALIISEAVAATASQMGDPNSKTSRSMSRNFNTPRTRG
jgi:lambda family phage tail tape measure protein